MQTAGRLRFSLFGHEIRNLTVAQRLSGFMYAVTCLFNVFLTAALFSMPAVLISGGRMVAYTDTEQLRWLIRSCWLAFIMNRICELSLFIPSGYRNGQRGSRAILWMAPCRNTYLGVFCSLLTFHIRSFDHHASSLRASILAWWPNNIVQTHGKSFLGAQRTASPATGSIVPKIEGYLVELFWSVSPFLRPVRLRRCREKFLQMWTSVHHE